jgi:hypothetical protein
LRRYQPDFPHIKPLLESDFLSEASFWESEQSPSDTTPKSHYLDIYETTASIENMLQKHNIRKDKSKVLGYDTLIPNLKSTNQKHICISAFQTAKETFIILSDFDRTELIGVLLSEF